jgi:NAD(P)-dependent dehydrogenase (short-subunit alcohol dehydrogenase family)
LIQHVVDTNITGTIYLIHQVGRDMRARGSGRILITGSIAGFMPGSFQAVYNGTKAFIDSFSWAIRNELKDTGVFRHVPDAWRDRHRILRARRADGYQGRHRSEGRSRRRGQGRVRRDAEGRR